MSFYDNGKIYKLVNNVDDKIYVGSTCNLLRVKTSHNFIQKISSILNQALFK